MAWMSLYCITFNIAMHDSIEEQYEIIEQSLHGLTSLFIIYYVIAAVRYRANSFTVTQNGLNGFVVLILTYLWLLVVPLYPSIMGLVITYSIKLAFLAIFIYLNSHYPFAGYLITMASLVIAALNIIYKDSDNFFMSIIKWFGKFLG